MFPGLSGFRWDAGHIIFLGAFYAVATVIACSLARVAWRALRDSVPRRAEAIRWRRDFSELPSADRRCRHELAGEIAQRECPNEFDCRFCADHRKFPRQVDEGNMLYHRGHSWAKLEENGDYTVGLDDFATHLLGPGCMVDLPAPGSEVFVNGTAFTVHKDGDSFRVLSPVEGNVVAAEHGQHGWILRVHPEANFRTDHLLSGQGASAWTAKERERLAADGSDVCARMLLNT